MAGVTLSSTWKGTTPASAGGPPAPCSLLPEQTGAPGLPRTMCPVSAGLGRCAGPSPPDSRTCAQASCLLWRNGHPNWGSQVVSPKVQQAWGVAERACLASPLSFPLLSSPSSFPFPLPSPLRPLLQPSVLAGQFSRGGGGVMLSEGYWTFTSASTTRV